MKVICIDGGSSAKCRNSGRIVPTPVFMETYTVVETRKSHHGGYCVYILSEMPHDVGYETYLFIPLSSIDETELSHKENRSSRWHRPLRRSVQQQIFIHQKINTMSDFKSRLVDEKQQLDEKLLKLQSFQDSENFKKIDPVQMTLLNIQSQAMATYSQCLLERIAWLEKEVVV